MVTTSAKIGSGPATAASGFLADVEQHCSAKARSSELVLSRCLKQHHPDYHVTEINISYCDLDEFADAGFAEKTLDNEDDSYTPLIEYTPNPFRLDSKTNPGHITLDPVFAKYRYTWQGNEFLFYIVRPKDPRGFNDLYHFLLSPRGPALTANHLTPPAEALVRAGGIWTNDLHEEVYVFDSGFWAKSKELWKTTESATWDDVVLDPATKDGLIEDVESFFDSQLMYQEFGVPWKRGVILHGLPGNGKTISIKALMSRLRKRAEPVPSLYVKSFEDRCSGSQFAIKTIFKKARRMAPCLLIFEDLDSLVTNKTRSYFLNEIDGLEANDGILIIGSTNHLDRLDPAIRDRPSRFDRKYFYRLPGLEERTAYARYWHAKLASSPRVDFPEAACAYIAAISDGFSYAYLKELFLAALLTIARGGKGDEPAETEDTPKSLEAKDEDEEAEDDEGKDKKKKGKKSKKSKAKKMKKAEKKKLLQKKQKETELKQKHDARREALAKLEVPEALRDCVLVKVMRQQIDTLLREMDNNELGAEEENKDKMGGCEDCSDSDSDSDTSSVTSSD